MMIRNIGLCGAGIRHSSPIAAPLSVGTIIHNTTHISSSSGGGGRRRQLQQGYYSSKPSWLAMKHSGKKRERQQERSRHHVNHQHSLHDMMHMAENDLFFGMSATMREFDEDHQESELTIFADSVESMFSDPFERLFQEADQQQWERHTTRIDLNEGTTVTRSYSSGKASKAEMMFDPFDELMNAADMFESESTLFFTSPRQKQRRTHTEKHGHEWMEFMEEECMAQQQQQQQQQQFELLAEREVLDALKRDDNFKRVYGARSKIIMGDKMCNFLSSSSSKYTVMEQTFTFTTGRGLVGTCTYQLQTLRSQQQNQHVNSSSNNNSSKRKKKRQKSAKKSSTSIDGCTLDLVVSEAQYHREQQGHEEKELYYHISTILVEDYMGERWHVTIDNRADQVKNMANGKSSDSTQETIYTAVVLENVDDFDPYSEEDEGARCYIVEKE